MRKNDKKQKFEKLMAIERESNILVDVKHNTSSSNSHTEDSKKLEIKYILLVILALIVIGAISMYAWAKYITRLNGSGQAQVAKWSFNYKILDSKQTTEVSDFSITRTDDNLDVDSNTIAPGTRGQFIIEIDASRNRDFINI